MAGGRELGDESVLEFVAIRVGARAAMERRAADDGEVRGARAADDIDVALRVGADVADRLIIAAAQVGGPLQCVGLHGQDLTANGKTESQHERDAGAFLAGWWLGIHWTFTRNNSSGSLLEMCGLAALEMTAQGPPIAGDDCSWPTPPLPSARYRYVPTAVAGQR